jgi:hypothetical protein
MVQARPVKVPAQVVVWAEARDKAEEEWAARLPQGRAVIAYVRTAVQQSLMTPVSLAIKEAVQNVVQK